MKLQCRCAFLVYKSTTANLHKSKFGIACCQYHDCCRLPGSGKRFTLFACFLQLEAALLKAQKLVKQNEEQQSSLQQKLESSMAGRQDTVRPSIVFDAHDQSLYHVCTYHLQFLSAAAYNACHEARHLCMVREGNCTMIGVFRLRGGQSWLK